MVCFGEGAGAHILGWFAVSVACNDVPSIVDRCCRLFMLSCHLQFFDVLKNVNAYSIYSTGRSLLGHVVM